MPIYKLSLGKRGALHKAEQFQLSTTPYNCNIKARFTSPDETRLSIAGHDVKQCGVDLSQLTNYGQRVAQNNCEKLGNSSNTTLYSITSEFARDMAVYHQIVVPYSITSVEYRADPGFLAVSLQVT